VDRFNFIRRRARAFTLLEIALIIAIIGMMVLIIVGYLLAPKGRKSPHTKETNPKVLRSTPAQTPAVDSTAPAASQPGATPATPASGTGPGKQPEASVVPVPATTPPAPPAFR
jgi:hypothetical protein